MSTTHNSRYLHVSFLLRQVLGAQSIAFKRPAMQQFEVINSANFNLVNKKNDMKQTNSCFSFGTIKWMILFIGDGNQKGKAVKDLTNNLYRLPPPVPHLLTSESAALLWLGLGWGFILRCGIATRGPMTRHLLLPMPSAILQIYMLLQFFQQLALSPLSCQISTV